MYILLPMDSEEVQVATLTRLDDVKIWTQILVEEGELVEVLHAKEKDGFQNFSECVVVVNDNEYVWPFMELNMMVLVAHTQRSIDAIVEAYLFKELHDLAY
ncbi:hypothetical protein [Sulfurimonas sp.]|uniref:hypothetical protein n=1 Tax=Sulfurimonas sp. TaxID=2022749 RepID=UPI002AB1BEC7|nr:hypothetical protein [Sulfurimonas sp.]